MALPGDNSRTRRSLRVARAPLASANRTVRLARSPVAAGCLCRSSAVVRRFAPWTGQIASAQTWAPGNVFYFVADLAAATSWYSARLGVEPVTRAPQLVMFDLPGARLTLHEADGFNQPGPSGTVPYWTVSDVDATVAEWSEYGACAHRGPKTIMTGERLCQMLDPFGNLFGLRQPPA